MVTANKHFQFSGYFVFEFLHETELHMQDSCNYVTLEQYAKIKVYQNFLAVMNLNCRSLCKNINDIEMLLMNLNQKLNKCLFTKTWLSQRLVPPCNEEFIDFINIIKNAEVEVYFCILVISILYRM